MGPKTIWKRAAALLAAVGVSIFLAGGISADEGNAEAEPAAALQPTEVVADIPTEYDTPFELQWGGGSLFQLKARLATMGCMANNIWIHNNNQWSLYNQYTLSHDLFFIQQFIQQYENNIPTGTLWADCYNVCEFGGERCLSFDELRVQEGNFKEYFAYIYSLRVQNFQIDETTPCTRNFHPTIQEHILPLLPIRPDACFVLKGKPASVGTGGVGGYTLFTSVNAPPFFVKHRYQYFVVQRNPRIHRFCVND